jgi:hypothetical protein
MWFAKTQSLRKDTPVKNSFVKQFDQNIKFNYSCFDRVVLRGYIIRLFFAGGIVVLLRALGFNSLSTCTRRSISVTYPGRPETASKRRMGDASFRTASKILKFLGDNTH